MEPNNNTSQNFLTREPEIINIDIKEREKILSHYNLTEPPKPQITGQPTLQDKVNLLNQNNRQSLNQSLFVTPTPSKSSAYKGFDGSRHGVNFDRYYNHPKFKEIGFNPYYNNDQIYNENSTHYDDFRRAMSQYNTMFRSAMVEQFKSWGDVLSGNFTDGGGRKAAEIMEEGMSIGSSTRDTFKGSATNMLLNSAYTMGIISEIALEELAMAIGTYASGGTAGPAALSRTGVNIGRAAKSLKQLFTALNSPNKARQAWAMGKISDAFFHVVPMGDTIKYGKDLYKGKKYKTLDDFAKTKKGFGIFYRDLREINAVNAEAKLEAGLVESSVRQELYNQYVNEFGRQPKDKDADTIDYLSKRASAQTYMGNLAGIYISNKIVLNTALKGITPLKAILRDKTGMFRSVINKSKTGQRTARVFDTSTGNFFKNIKDKEFRRDAYKNLYHPKRILGTGLRYTSANLSEGFQEIFQESLSAGLNNYYANALFSPTMVPRAEMMQTLREGFRELDEQNMTGEIFLSGFLMGSVAGVYQKALYKGFPTIADRISTKSEERKKIKDEREKRRAQLETALQTLLENPADTFNTLYSNANYADEYSTLMDYAQDAGDTKKFHDFKNDALFQHIITLYNNNMGDDFIDMLKDMGQLTDDELSQAFSEELKNDDINNTDIRKRIDAVIDRAEYIKQRKVLADEMYPNPFDGKNFFAQLSWQNAINDFVYQEFLLRDTTNRMESLMTKLSQINFDDKSNAVGQMLAGHFSTLLEEDLFNTEVKLLESEINNLEFAGGKENIDKANKKKGVLNTYKAVRSALNGLSSLYNDQLSVAARNAQEQVENDSKVFAAGREVEYVNSKGDKRRGTILRFASDPNKVIIKLESGRTATVSKDKIAFMSELEEDVDPQEFAQLIADGENLLLEAFSDFVVTISRDQGRNVDPSVVVEASQAMVDYAKLNVDGQRASEAINLLYDPYYFNELANRHKQALEQQNEIIQSKQKELLDAFLKTEDLNKLLKELYDKFGVFVDPNEIKELNDNGKIPDVFFRVYEQNGKEVTEEITLGNKLYPQIVQYIEEFEDREGVIFVNKHSLGLSPLGYGSNQRGFFDIDSSTKPSDRSLSEIMKVFEMDRVGGTISLSDLIKLLNKNDKVGTNEMLMLDALLRRLGPTHLVKFDIAHPIAFSINEDNVLVINHTLAASDYNAMSIGLVPLIINALAYEITSKSQKTEEFVTAETEIYNKVYEYYKTFDLTDEQKNILSNQLGLPVDQLQESILKYLESTRRTFDQNGLVSAALTSLQFQKIYAFVPTGVENNNKVNNALTDFIAAIQNFLRSILNLPKESNALNDLLDVIGRIYFEDTGIIQPDGSSFDSLPPDLQSKLQDAYDNDTNPEKPDNISDWINNSAKAQKIINDYNKDKESNVNSPLTNDEKAELYKLDYDDSDFPSKEPVAWRNIIRSQTRKPKPTGTATDSDKEQLRKVRDEFDKHVEQNVIEFYQLPNVSNARVLATTLRLKTQGQSVEQKLEALNEAMMDIFGKVSNPFTMEDFINDEELLEKTLESIRYIPGKGYALRASTINKLNQEIIKVQGKNIQDVFTAFKIISLEDLDIDPATGHRGTLIDELVRLVLTSDEVVEFDRFNQKIDDVLSSLRLTSPEAKGQDLIEVPDTIRQKIYESIIDLKKMIEDAGLIPYALKNVMYGNLNGIPVSGDTDILLLDKDGNVYLSDIKTSMIGENKSVKKNIASQFRYGAQLNIYRELMTQNGFFTNKKFKLNADQGIINFRTNLNKQGDSKPQIFDSIILESRSGGTLQSLLHLLPTRPTSELFRELIAAYNNNAIQREPLKPVHKSLDGKIIYVSMALQGKNAITQELAMQYQNLEFLDDVLISMINERLSEFNTGFTVVDQTNIAHFLNEQYNIRNGSKVLGEIYNDINKYVNDEVIPNGKTIITSMRGYINKADFVLMSNDIKDYKVYDIDITGMGIENLLDIENTSSNKYIYKSNTFSIEQLLDNGAKKSRLKPPKIDYDGLLKRVNQMNDLELQVEMETQKPVLNIDYGVSEIQYINMLEDEWQKRLDQRQNAEDLSSTSPTTNDANNMSNFDDEDMTDEDWNSIGNCN